MLDITNCKQITRFWKFFSTCWIFRIIKKTRFLDISYRRERTSFLDIWNRKERKSFLDVLDRKESTLDILDRKERTPCLDFWDRKESTFFWVFWIGTWDRKESIIFSKFVYFFQLISRSNTNVFKIYFVLLLCFLRRNCANIHQNDIFSKNSNMHNFDFLIEVEVWSRDLTSLFKHLNPTMQTFGFKIFLLTNQTFETQSKGESLFSPKKMGKNRAVVWFIITWFYLKNLIR